jgi:ureidoacrylate peracid hydrolase
MLKIDVPGSALLMLHCQNDLVKPDGKFAASGMPAQVANHDLLHKWATILKASREAGLRVIYVNNVFTPGFPELGPTPFPLMVGTRGYNAFLKGTWGAANPQEIAPHEGELVIDNYNSSAFSYTSLDLVLRANGIRNLYLAGVATTFVINSTARYGAELGYLMTIIADACTSFSDEMHDFEIAKVLPHFGAICQSTELIAGLKQGCG